MLAGHVIHLPVVVCTLDAASELAARLAESLAFLLPDLDTGEITVSAEDAQYEHHRVFCDRLLRRGVRCGGRARHPGSCTPRPGVGLAGATVGVPHDVPALPGR